MLGRQLSRNQWLGILACAAGAARRFDWGTFVAPCIRHGFTCSVPTSTGAEDNFFTASASSGKLLPAVRRGSFLEDA